jgi:glucan phosphoethanolaminetransferase (alkaline phosphatase superfamily)
VSGVFAVTMNVVVFVQDGVRVIVGHRLAVDVGICVVFVAGLIWVVGVLCFRSGVITMVIAVMVGSAHDVPSVQPGRGRDNG